MARRGKRRFFSCCQHYQILCAEGWTFVAVSLNDVPALKFLAIDFFAMADAEHQHDEPIVFDLRDEPVIAYAVFPEFPKLRAVQRLSDAAGVVQLGYSLMKKLQDALGRCASSLPSSRSADSDSSTL
jgi:hypothetical protein